MNTLKGWITTLLLTLTLMATTAFADGVIIGGGRGVNQPCTPPVKENVDGSAIIGGLAAEILRALTGVIIGGGRVVVTGPVANCSVINGG